MQNRGEKPALKTSVHLAPLSDVLRTNFMMVFARLVKDLQDFAAVLFVCLLAVGGKEKVNGGFEGLWDPRV